MIGIGKKVPPLRIPALLKGTLRYLGLDHFEGRWTLLCFPARLTFEEAQFLTSRSGIPSAGCEHVCVLAVSSDSMLLHQRWALDFSGGVTALLIDPLKRLHRQFGVSRQWPTRCQSFVISPCGRLEFLMVHQLKGQGISTLAEILHAGMACYQAQPANNSAFSQKRCAMRTVPRNDEKLEVTTCPCGTISLTYGGLRLTFPAEEFFAFIDKMTRMARIVTAYAQSSPLCSTVWN